MARACVRRRGSFAGFARRRRAESRLDGRRGRAACGARRHAAQRGGFPFVVRGDDGRKRRVVRLEPARDVDDAVIVEREGGEARERARWGVFGGGRWRLSSASSWMSDPGNSVSGTRHDAGSGLGWNWVSRLARRCDGIRRWARSGGGAAGASVSGTRSVSSSGAAVSSSSCRAVSRHSAATGARFGGGGSGGDARVARWSGIPLGRNPADGRPTRQRVDQRLQLRVEVRGALEGDPRGWGSPRPAPTRRRDWARRIARRRPRRRCRDATHPRQTAPTTTRRGEGSPRRTGPRLPLTTASHLPSSTTLRASRECPSDGSSARQVLGAARNAFRFPNLEGASDGARRDDVARGRHSKLS